ncbi:hypothetical protein GCM10023081_16980 [Arthrobacter ginkgonis]|uniref:GtrA/DPMS transmembrane domain-containing protein n=1 Tax=Arthrobacter ginkgonis TaxID=1630594 RepID=A0ABP7C7X3_9MICC
MLKKLYGKARGLVSALWREVAKFGTVGGISFVIDNGVTLLLMHGVMSGSEAKARFVGATVATLFSWAANRYWTFRHRRQANMAREFGMFFLINGIGIGISTGFTAIAKYGLGIQDKNLLFAAGVVGIVVATVVRFLAYRFWVFTAEHPSKRVPSAERELVHAAPGAAETLSGAVPETVPGGSRDTSPAA